jgi:antitoxin component of MazEF toxin-antitoxin module
MELRDVGSKLVTDPHQPPLYKLEDLLKRVSKRNIHPECKTGRPIGKEAL